MSKKQFPIFRRAPNDLKPPGSWKPLSKILLSYFVLRGFVFTLLNSPLFRINYNCPELIIKV